jgi:hypothetical protein
VSLAYANRSREQEALPIAVDGIAVHEAASHHQRFSQGGICICEIRVVIIERAVFVAWGNRCAVEEASYALLQLALAGLDYAATAGDGCHPYAQTATPGTNLLHGKTQYRRLGEVEKGSELWRRRRT